MGLGAFLADVWRALAGVSFAALAFAVMLHLLKVAAEARSWHAIVSHTYPPQGRVSFRTTLGAFIASIAANAVLPARIGEGLRVGIVRRAVADSSLAAIAATVALETILEVIFGIAMVVAWIAGGGTLGSGGSVLHALSRLAASPLALALAGVALVTAAALARRFRTRARSFLARCGEGFAILRSPGVFARSVLAWKLVAWLLRFASVVVFLAAFHLPAALWAALAVVAAQTVAGTVPLLPGNAGTQQAAIGVALGGTVGAAATIGFGVGMQAATTLADLALAAVAVAMGPGSLRRRGAPQPLEAGPDGGGSTIQPAGAGPLMRASTRPPGAVLHHGTRRDPAGQAPEDRSRQQQATGVRG